MAPFSSNRAGVRECCSSISAVSPMISGSVWNSRSSSRASRIASSQSGARAPLPPGAGRVSLVEDEVDHRGDRGEPLRALHRAGRLERHVGRRDAALRARDALLHGGLAHQEGAGDLFYGEAGDDAQRERDLLRRRQLGMAADEEEAEDVVAIVRAVEALRQRVLRVVQVRDDRLLGQRFLPAAPPHGVDGGVAPDEDEPGGGIARRAVLRPASERAQAGVLERLLRRVEIAKIAQERADRLGAGGGQRRVDPGDFGHAATSPGLKSATGRSS